MTSEIDYIFFIVGSLCALLTCMIEEPYASITALIAVACLCAGLVALTYRWFGGD